VTPFLRGIERPSQEFDCVPSDCNTRFRLPGFLSSLWTQIYLHRPRMFAKRPPLESFVG
jgi:hypothetical protein